MTETLGPAHLVRVVGGQARVGHPKVCPRLVADGDEAADDVRFQCGLGFELEQIDPDHLLDLVDPGVTEFLVQFWSEETLETAWGPGDYRSGIRLVESSK